MSLSESASTSTALPSTPVTGSAAGPVSEGSAAASGRRRFAPPPLLATAAVAVALVALAFTWRRLFLGTDLSDEGFYVAVPYRLALGARPFVDEMSILQTAEFFVYPVREAVCVACRRRDRPRALHASLVPGVGDVRRAARVSGTEEAHRLGERPDRLAGLCDLRLRLDDQPELQHARRRAAGDRHGARRPRRGGWRKQPLARRGGGCASPRGLCLPNADRGAAGDCGVPGGGRAGSPAAGAARLGTGCAGHPRGGGHPAHELRRRQRAALPALAAPRLAPAQRHLRACQARGSRVRGASPPAAVPARGGRGTPGLARLPPLAGRSPGPGSDTACAAALR